MLKVYNYETRTNDSKKIVFTDALDYIEARVQADIAPEFANLTLLNMPRLIKNLQDDEAAELIRRSWVDTISGEYFLTDYDSRIYAVAHGNHPLAYSNRLESEWSKRMSQYNGVVPITMTENDFLLANAIPLSKVKEGYDAGNAVIYLNLDQDSLQIFPSEEDLNYAQWMLDDRILAVCGSEKNRKSLGKFLFEKEKRDTIGNSHQLNNFAIYDQLCGKLLGLREDGEGIIDEVDEVLGRFAAGNKYKK